MRISKISMMAAATLFAATPVLAQPANPAESLSVGKSVRAGGKQHGKDSLAGGGGFVIAALAIAAVIAGVVVVANNKDRPESP